MTHATSALERKGMRRALAFAAVWAVFVISWQWNGLHYDLNALYMAGHFLAQDRPDLVYAVALDTFPLTSHPDWLALSEPWDCGAFCAYPYVYPPIWAVMTAPLSGVLDMRGFSNAALLLQIPLFALCPLLAWRLWRPRIGPVSWTLRCLLLATVCTMGTTSLVNNQPQLLVTFLLLAGFERAAHGRPWLGGAALGLAAAIKIYPVLFGLIWLQEGNWRALAGATLAGGGMLALNMALVDPALNAAFLDQARTLSAGVFPAAWNYSLASLLGWLDPASADPWTAVTDPHPAARIGGPLLLVAGLVLMGWRARTAGPIWRRRVLLPALAALAVLASPIGWAYYLFIPLFAVQLLPEHYGRAGALLLLGLTALVFLPFYILFGVEIGPDATLLGVAFTAGTFLALALAPARRLPDP
ncbi:MAG: glycosyltransferase family 87 protein [Pseudomonadota bacterium]